MTMAGEIQFVRGGVLSKGALNGLVKVRNIESDQTKEKTAAMDSPRKSQVAKALQLVLGSDDQRIDARPEFRQLFSNMLQKNLSTISMHLDKDGTLFSSLARKPVPQR